MFALGWMELLILAFLGLFAVLVVIAMVAAGRSERRR
jgi:hypothetical protein